MTETPAEPAVSEEAVRAFLSSPAGAEMLEEILMSMMAKQAAAPPAADPTTEAKTPRRSLAKSTDTEALFQAPEVGEAA
ncbi:hypothetical protein [Nonomuraea indica]|uniref:IS256 family transposase n=1 Tax=Nonomuraea indica TaxID=1581193 RepID=A0ABW8A0Y8_9ACTN